MIRRRALLAAALAVLLCGAAVGLYIWLQGPVGGVSPYETVNDLYEWEYMTFTADQAVYPADVETVTLYFRNDAPDGVVWLSESPSWQWYLERKTDGAWHSIRSTVEIPQWRFREEDCTLYSTPSGVVDWNGGEFTWFCDIGDYYRTPLECGSYRIVIPDCSHRDDHGTIAVEFEVCQLAGCGVGAGDASRPAEAPEELPAEEPPAEEPRGNPIDRWHQEMAAEYGNSHTDGFLNYLYGDAWQAELEAYLETAYPGSENAASYRESVDQAAEAREGLQEAKEIEAGWATGSSGRISMAGAEVYRQAFLSFAEPQCSQYTYLFDAEAYTAAFLEGLEN